MLVGAEPAFDAKDDACLLRFRRDRFEPAHHFIHPRRVVAQIVLAEEGEQDHAHAEDFADVNAVAHPLDRCAGRSYRGCCSARRWPVRRLPNRSSSQRLCIAAAPRAWRRCMSSAAVPRLTITPSRPICLATSNAAGSPILPMDQSHAPSRKRRLSGAANSGAQFAARASQAVAWADRRIIPRRESPKRWFFIARPSAANLQFSMRCCLYFSSIAFTRRFRYATGPWSP